MKEVVRVEILKLVNVGIIYAISDSSWAFNAIEKLVLAPVMIVPDWSQPFEVMCHACDFEIGAVIVFIDHATLHYLFGKKDADRTLIRWILLLQKFDLEVQDKKGSKNSVADHFSRLEQEEVRLDSVIQEAFPDEQLFACEIKLPWYADIVNYLACKVLPPDLTYHQPVDYVLKWVEAIAATTNNVKVVLKFLHKNIFTRFGTPRAIISDEGTHFCNKLFDNLLSKYGVKHKIALAYHP
ncbi:uncharacterized protein LOC121262072 [Juglans microcarpa x Juglans regia]|uniref:uncharacterized protein LOC121262072 n=1 Tax=Juglans microcarpa x Juglans regia TaxID=2249226 RepID=UPI001B7ECAF7|nr:uncharacterized protein LOC121262072 [Juglans microcarpa x Juglans regia]